MSRTLSGHLSHRLAALVRSYASGHQEEALALGYELGREILRSTGEQEVGLLELATAHQDALSEVLERTDPWETERTLEAAGTVLSDVLAPVEMALRGFRETNQTLRRLNATLERKVAERTRSLEQSLEHLRAADTERRGLLARAIAAQEEERRRIAAEIHDDPIQVMAAVGIRIQLLRQRLAGDPELLRLVEKLDETTKLTVRRLRNLMFQLRPRMLDRDGLAATLRFELERLQEEMGIETDLEDRLRAEPSPDVRSVLYRIVREALANARKHSGAGRVDVLIETRDEGVLVRVADDGDGFDGETATDQEPGHAGLVDMRERTQLVQGKLRIESRPGEGCLVEVWVPASIDAPRAPGEPR